MEDYQKAIPEKLEFIKDLIQEFKSSKDRESLESLRSSLYSMAKSSKLEGFLKVSILCDEMVKNLEEKLTQFDQTKDFAQWIKKLETFFNHLKKAFQENRFNDSQKFTALIIDDD